MSTRMITQEERGQGGVEEVGGLVENLRGHQSAARAHGFDSHGHAGLAAPFQFVVVDDSHHGRVEIGVGMARHVVIDQHQSKLAALLHGFQVDLVPEAERWCEVFPLTQRLRL